MHYISVYIKFLCSLPHIAHWNFVIIQTIYGGLKNTIYASVLSNQIFKTQNITFAHFSFHVIADCILPDDEENVKRVHGNKCMKHCELFMALSGL